jgi:hypothetical protein
MSAPAADPTQAAPEDEGAGTPTERPTATQPSTAVDHTPSVLDSLRDEFAQQVEVKRLFKRLPARNERLVAEYAPLELADATKAIEQQSDPSMLVSSLKGIWMHLPDSELANDRGLVPLGAACEQPLLDPLLLDKRLTDLLSIKYGSSESILLDGMFEGNDLALAAQSAELGEWSVKTKREDLQDFLKR